MKYFGTDGIRQEATFFTADFLARIIRGLIDYAGDDIKIFLAGDTRESTEWILQDLGTACESFGIEYGSAGVLPTPAINYCFYQMGFDFAIDVTASHNPYTDNGIKIFQRGDGAGQKLSEEACQVIEKAIDKEEFSFVPVSVTYREDLHGEAVELYRKHLLEYVGDVDCQGITLALDCANGATSVIGSSVFEELGAKTQEIHVDQNYNTRINKDCGSTHPEALQALVVDNQLDLGFAFDGDGDRCLCVDSTGVLVDGDEIMAILANYLGLLKIAVTVMSNQGLLNWAEKAGVETEITPVGDSNVALAMRSKQIELGGEQSGHIILPGEPSGDGLLTALMIMKVVSSTHTALSELKQIMTKLPQVIVNMSATPEQKVNLKTSEGAKKLLLDYNQKLESLHGRLLVRPSGTESLIRITIWGDDLEKITQFAEELKAGLQEVL